MYVHVCAQAVYVCTYVHPYKLYELGKGTTQSEMSETPLSGVTHECLQMTQDDVDQVFGGGLNLKFVLFYGSL